MGHAWLTHHEEATSKTRLQLHKESSNHTMGFVSHGAYGAEDSLI